MELTVKTLPLDKLYKFDDNKYVMAHITRKTIGGMYIKGEPLRLTYVFEFDEDDNLVKVVSGRIVDKRESYDINKEFMIVDYDTEDAYTYQIKKSLRDANINDVYKVSKASLSQSTENRKTKR